MSYASVNICMHAAYVNMQISVLHTRTSLCDCGPETCCISTVYLTNRNSATYTYVYIYIYIHI